MRRTLPATARAHAASSGLLADGFPSSLFDPQACNCHADGGLRSVDHRLDVADTGGRAGPAGRQAMTNFGDEAG
jgi:hypothetical protein